MVSQPQIIKCDQCSYVAEDVAEFVKHIRYVHTAEHCRYCVYRAKDKEDLQTHLVNDHEDMIILHSMAQQVEVINEKFENFETFKEELGAVIKSIAETQLAVKQELFLIRNKQAELCTTKATPSETPSEQPLEKPSEKPFSSSSGSSAASQSKQSSTPRSPPASSRAPPSPPTRVSQPTSRPKPSNSSRVPSPVRQPVAEEKKTLFIGEY
jgi:hypothetical protein